MEFYEPKMRHPYPAGGVPPLVSPVTRKRIRLGVTAAHLLFIGLPLAIMCIAAWLTPAPKKVIVIDMIALPASQSSPAPQAPAPPSVQTPPRPTQPKPFTNAPLAPSVVDTAPKPKPDPVKPPKPAKPVDPPKPAKPAEAKPPQPTQPAQPSQPTWTAVDPSTLNSRNPNSNPNATANPTGAAADPTYDGKLYKFVKMIWDDLAPSKVQLGGSKPTATITVTIAPDGTVRNAVVKTPSGVAAMDAAVRRLCDQLKSGKAPRPNGGAVERDIILECN